jgi:ribosomal protein S18 acetylase RimI-like enzyme
MTHAKGELADGLVAIVDTAASERDLKIVEHGLIDHALQSRVEPRNHTPLVIMVQEARGDTVAGLVADTVWGWLQIKQVWVAELFRHRGLGRKLLLLAESEAAKRGCHHAMLDTFDFQALSFYERSGYQVFGRLDDFPRGHSRYFLAKKLSA